MSGIQTNITRYSEEQENMTSDNEKNQPIKTNPELTLKQLP